jgi:hypothetical protein
MLPESGEQGEGTYSQKQSSDVGAQVRAADIINCCNAAPCERCVEAKPMLCSAKQRKHANCTQQYPQ